MYTESNYTWNSPKNLKKELNAYRISPSLKTCRDLASVEVAPTNADEFVNGVRATLSGTLVNASIPLKLRDPSFRTGFVLRNMECLHDLLPLMPTKPGEKTLWFVPTNEEKPKLSCRAFRGGGDIMVV